MTLAQARLSACTCSAELWSGSALQDAAWQHATSSACPNDAISPCHRRIHGNDGLLLGCLLGGHGMNTYTSMLAMLYNCFYAVFSIVAITTTTQLRTVWLHVASCIQCRSS